jgi:tRNA(Arg) A34 adenosine deaminase TadA
VIRTTGVGLGEADEISEAEREEAKKERALVVGAAAVGLDVVAGGRGRAAVDRDPTTHARHRPSLVVNGP